MSCNFDYSGKTVLVTGSTKGIGLSIADSYVKAGANVIFNGRKEDAVKKIINDLSIKYKIDISKTPGRLIGAIGDVGTKEGCDKVIDCIKKSCNGYINILINNVGIFESKDFDEITDERWIEMFNINVMSCVRLSRYCIAKMLEPLNDSNNTNENDEKSELLINKNNNNAKKIDLSNLNIERKGGNIVMISSECGLKTLPNMIHYSMTKTCQLALSRGLAQMCKGIPNVRVNSLLPGPTMTEGVETYLQALPENKDLGDSFDLNVARKAYFKDREPHSLKQDFLDPKEVADTCLFLTSDNASGITGHSQRCEGGIVYHI